MILTANPKAGLREPPVTGVERVNNDPYADEITSDHNEKSSVNQVDASV